MRERRPADVLDVIVDQAKQRGPVGGDLQRGQVVGDREGATDEPADAGLVQRLDVQVIAGEAHRAGPGDRLHVHGGGRGVDRRIEGTVEVGDLDATT